MTNKVCEICNKSNLKYESIQYLPTTMHKLEDFDRHKIIICEHCGFGGIEEPISLDRLDDYYTNFYNGISLKSQNAKYKLSQGNYIDNSRAASQITLLTQFINQDQELNVLEIGSGRGDFLFLFKQIFRNSNVSTFEPQIQSQKMLRDKGIIPVPFSFDCTKNEELKEKYDLIVMSHSLEHFNPNQINDLFECIYFMLKNKALYLCEVPNADLSKYKSEAIVPHLSFFTQESLNLLIKKHQMESIFDNTCGRKQKTNNENNLKEIEKLISKDKFNFIKDINSKDVFININTYQEHKNITKLERLKEFIFSIVGKKIYLTITDQIKKLRMPYVSEILSNKEFHYGGEREFIRIIAKKNTKK